MKKQSLAWTFERPIRITSFPSPQYCNQKLYSWWVLAYMIFFKVAIQCSIFEGYCISWFTMCITLERFGLVTTIVYISLHIFLFDSMSCIPKRKCKFRYFILNSCEKDSFFQWFSFLYWKEVDCPYTIHVGTSFGELYNTPKWIFSLKIKFSRCFKFLKQGLGIKPYLNWAFF